jgi:hypothetical protein
MFIYFIYFISSNRHCLLAEHYEYSFVLGNVWFNNRRSTSNEQYWLTPRSFLVKHIDKQDKDVNCNGTHTFFGIRRL